MLQESELNPVVSGGLMNASKISFAYTSKQQEFFFESAIRFKTLAKGRRCWFYTRCYENVS